MGGIRVRDHRVGRSRSDRNRVGVEVDFWVSYGCRRVLDVAVDVCVFGFATLWREEVGSVHGVVSSDHVLVLFRRVSVLRRRARRRGNRRCEYSKNSEHDGVVYRGVFVRRGGHAAQFIFTLGVGVNSRVPVRREEFEKSVQV